MGAFTFRALACAVALLLILRVLWEDAMLSAYAALSHRGDLNRGALYREALRQWHVNWAFRPSSPPSCAQLLRNELHAWRVNATLQPQRSFPQTLVDIAAQCTVEEAASAALDASGAVVEVGGGTVALAALRQHARVVVAVEPDPRVFDALQARAEQMPGARFFFGFRAAAGERSGRRQMLFRDSVSGESCFDCQDMKGKDVFAAEIRVDTVDNLLRSAGLPEILEIALLEMDTQGFELQALRGAKSILGKGMVHAVLVKFDIQLLKTRENSVRVLDVLVTQGLECLHLVISGGKRRLKKGLRFAQLPLAAANKLDFYEFLRKQNGRTHMFCLRRPTQRGQLKPTG